MSAPRASSMLPLRQMASGPRLLGPRLLSRNLHMSGPTDSPSRFLTSEKPFSGEVKKQMKREIKQSRALHPTTAPRAAHDNSTIDFAFLPEQEVLFSGEDKDFQIRMPIIPSTFLPSRTPINNIDIPVHRPIISTVGDNTHGDHVLSPHTNVSAVEEALKGHVDFEEVAEEVMDSTKAAIAGRDVKGKGEEAVAKAQGLVRQVWNGLLDDVFGKRGLKVGKA